MIREKEDRFILALREGVVDAAVVSDSGRHVVLGVDGGVQIDLHGQQQLEQMAGLHGSRRSIPVPELPRVRGSHVSSAVIFKAGGTRLAFSSGHMLTTAVQGSCAVLHHEQARWSFVAGSRPSWRDESGAPATPIVRGLKDHWVLSMQQSPVEMARFDTGERRLEVRLADGTRLRAHGRPEITMGSPISQGAAALAIDVLTDVTGASLWSTTIGTNGRLHLVFSSGQHVLLHPAGLSVPVDVSRDGDSLWSSPLPDAVDDDDPLAPLVR